MNINEVEIKPFELKAALKEARREMGERTENYPIWLSTGKISKARAEVQMKGLKATLKILEALDVKSEAKPVQSSIFENF